MSFHPPIKERSVDELIEIANFPDMWQPEAVEEAVAELEKRGVSEQEQAKMLEKLERDLYAELKCEIRKRAIVKFHPIDLFFMFIRLPATILSGWYLKRDGYIKMHKQRLWVIASGFMFYAFSMLFVYFSSLGDEEAKIKLIQEQDISEWEKSYYGEERDSI